MHKNIASFLDSLNRTYAGIHRAYEEAFWVSYMGDHAANARMQRALVKRDAFRSDRKRAARVHELLESARGTQRTRLGFWKLFFSKYQIPEHVLAIKQEIDALESELHKKHATQQEGYQDPKTGKFIDASRVKMSMMVRTEKDESLRKAAWKALEELAGRYVGEYVRLVGLRNTFARALGYEDFYAYKLATEEGMTKKELFSLFDAIYEKTKYAFKDIRNLEKKMPGLRKPWNFGFMLAGDFTKEEDQYYPFDEALMRWGRSFAALGINYQGGELQLDLLDRKGKYNNGFCHYPNVVYQKDGSLEKGSSNFTCNVVYGQVGSGMQGMHTLFHEGGHAADRLNSMQPDACINTEYPPASTAWAETQSMFLDTMFSSIEWRTRYATNKQGQAYPFDLFKRRTEKLGLLAPLGMMGIHDVMEFERRVYEAKNLTSDAVLKIARQAHRKFFDRSEDSISMMNVPHIFSWENACSYHGYGLAELALAQWREYFYEKYGFIVDNPRVGKEMTSMWKLGSSKTFPECVRIATGKKLSPVAFIKNATRSVPARLALAKKRLARMEKVKSFNRSVDLNASIRMVHGKKVIADNKKSFEAMAGTYAKWLGTQKH